MGRIYNFPCKREDIDKCCDVQQLKEWQHQFELSLCQMESDYGGIENVPEKLYKYAKANELNLKQIKFKIRKLTGPITSAGVLKCFHDVVRELDPEYHASVTEEVKKRICKEDEDWDELINFRRHGTTQLRQA